MRKQECPICRERKKLAKRCTCEHKACNACWTAWFKANPKCYQNYCDAQPRDARERYQKLTVDAEPDDSFVQCEKCPYLIPRPVIDPLTRLSIKYGTVILIGDFIALFAFEWTIEDWPLFAMFFAVVVGAKLVLLGAAGGTELFFAHFLARLLFAVAAISSGLAGRASLSAFAPVISWYTMPLSTIAALIVKSRLLQTFVKPLVTTISVTTTAECYHCSHSQQCEYYEIDFVADRCPRCGVLSHRDGGCSTVLCARCCHYFHVVNT